MRPRMLSAAGAVVLVALAGCGGGGASGRPSASGRPGGASDAAPLIAAASCMRANGFPAFPDPVQHDGRWVVPLNGPDMPTPPAACVALFDQSKQGGERRNAVSAADMAKLRQWAPGAQIQTDESTCTPGSVPALRRGAAIHLGLPLPAGSSGPPAGSGGPPSNACAGPPVWAGPF